MGIWSSLLRFSHLPEAAAFDITSSRTIADPSMSERDRSFAPFSG